MIYITVHTKVKMETFNFVTSAYSSTLSPLAYKYKDNKTWYYEQITKVTTHDLTGRQITTQTSISSIILGQIPEKLPFFSFNVSQLICDPEV